MPSKRLAGVLLATAGCASSGGQRPARVTDPRGILPLTRASDISLVKLSPDGAHIAAMSNAGGETTLGFFRTDDLQRVGGFRLTGTDMFLDVTWANNERVVAELARREGPLETPQSFGEIYAIELDGTKSKLIFGYRAGDSRLGSRISSSENIDAWGSIEAVIPNRPDHILVRSVAFPQTGEALAARLSEAYAVDVYTGRRQRLAGGPGLAVAYYLDEAGAVRLALSLSESSALEAYWLDGEWKKLTAVVDLSPNAVPQGFSASARVLYFVDEDSEGPALFSVNIDSGERKVVARVPGVEPGQIIFNPKDGTVGAVEFELEYPIWKFVDETQPIVQAMKLALEKFPGQHARWMSASEDGTRSIVLVYGDRTPGAFCLVAEKVADPKRICTFGSSFGGYSAMQTVIRAPELFRCAVGYAGIYDLGLMHEEGDLDRTERGRAFLAKSIGGAPAALRAASPVRNAGKISVPVLLLHGAKDQRAPISHAEALRAALKERKKPCEELYFSSEGHGFYDDDNRHQAHERVLEFVEAHTR